MYEVHVLVGEHGICFTTDSDSILEWLHRNFCSMEASQKFAFEPSLSIRVESGYGRPFKNFDVRVESSSDNIVYCRQDYMIHTSSDYRKSCVKVFDEFALKHALMNLYSAFVVHYGWGLLIHSSCVVQDDKAYLFAGHSGAGKSTVARLSTPRPLLSDEATVVRIRDDDVVVFDSPFRSDSYPLYDPNPYRLEAIHILRQSNQVVRSRVGASEGVFKLMDKVFYWAHNPDDTMKILTLQRQLAKLVPIYELYFQKNNTFWEAIS